MALDIKDLKNVSIVDHYEPAEITSGDWFSANFEPSNNRLYIMIGDVTGHGMISALVTVATAGAAKGALTTLKETGQGKTMKESLEILSQSINSAVSHSGRKVDRSMTMVFICIDLATGDGAYLNAGHNNIYIKKNDGIVPLLKPGEPLGYHGAKTKFGYRDFKLNKNESLFLYTDGLIENEGPNKKTFRRNKLKRILEQPLDLHEIKEQILEEGAKVWQDVTPEDDCTFLLIKWRGPS